MSKFVAWIDQRLPVSKFVKNHLSEYYALKILTSSISLEVSPYLYLFYR